MGPPHAADSGPLWYLSLGSNVGDRCRMLVRALERLAATEGVEVVRTSSIYETQPWGDTDQPAFLNLVAVVRSRLAPLELLAAVKRIERELGRVPRRRWGPREIDIDLLLCRDLRLELPELKLPHPLIAERQFVLVPLAELDPDTVVAEGRRARDLAVGDGTVRKVADGPSIRAAGT